jgi:hypothetical protein
MAELHSASLDDVLQEASRLPAEYLPVLLKLMRAFREGVMLPSAEESLRQGWQEAQDGDTRPVDELWDDAP